MVPTTQPPAPPAARARYAYVDGLRGFAAVWVVLYHLWNRFHPGLSTQSHPLADGLPADPWAALGLATFGLGYTGVTLFFVLSGFCIHLPQARRGADRVAVGPFAARRFWRLYPAYAASILFAVFALALPKLLLAAGGRSFDWWHEVRGADALVNAAFLQQVWPESLTFNGVYWTLVYEVQFYAAYPALLFGVRRLGLAPVGAALLASEVYLAYFPVAVPCFFLGRYFEWFLGVVAAEVVAGRARTPPGAATICAGVGFAAGVAAVLRPDLYPLRDLGFAVGYFGLLLLAAGRPRVTALFGRPQLAAVGQFSYSLYLVHIPVIDLVWVGLDRLVLPRTHAPGLVQWAAVAALPLSLAVAYGFYRLFERPFLRDGSAAPAAATAG